MTRNSKIKEISGTIRLAALELNNHPEAKDKLLKIAQGLDMMMSGNEGQPDAESALSALGPAMPEGMGTQDPSAMSQPVSKPKSKFGLDQEQQRYYKVNVEFLYIPASDNLEAREKVRTALDSISEFQGKFNVGEAQGQSVKEPS